MSGPARQRLDQGLQSTNREAVHSAELAWRRSSRDMVNVVQGLKRAAESGGTFGGKTGPALWDAMDTAATNLLDHAEEMGHGADALERSATVITAAHQDRTAIDTDLPVRHANPYRSKPGDEDLDQAQFDLKKQKHDQQQGGLVADRETQREIRAQEVADAMEQDYEHPIAVMKKIYGYEETKKKRKNENTRTPYAPGGRSGGPSGTGGPSGPGGPGGRSSSDAVGPWRGGDTIDVVSTDDDPQVDGGQDSTTDSTTGGPPWGDGAGGDQLPGNPLPDSLPTPDPTGSAGAPAPHGSSGFPPVLGGAAATVGVGGLAAGLARRGGATGLTGLTSRLSTGSVAPIGSSSRIAGAIGSARTGATTGTSTGRAGAGGMGTGARGGPRGMGAGTRGSAGGRGGGRGAGTGAGGRRGGKKDHQNGADRDLFDDGEDWLDDEGAAPGTLD